MKRQASLKKTVIKVALAAFAAGAVVQLMQLPLFTPLDRALAGGRSWFVQWKDVRAELEKQKQTALWPPLPARASVVTNSADAFKGYTLVNTLEENIVYLVDMKGNMVHTWDVDYRKLWDSPPHIPHHVPLALVSPTRTLALPNGNLLVVYFGMHDTPYGYGAAMFDKNSNIIWKYAGRAHHDADIDEQGRIYLLTHEIRNTPIPNIHLQPPLLTDYVTVLSPEGKEIAKIDLVKVMQDTPYLSVLNKRNEEADNGDLMHTNTVSVLKSNVDYKLPQMKPGQIMVSLRESNILLILDPVTKKAVWGTRGPWKAQHQPVFLKNGNIMLFDNRSKAGPKVKESDRRSRVLIFDPASKRVVWRYDGGSKEIGFYSDVRSMAQPLANGNVFITLSERGRLMEVTPRGKVVWDYRSSAPESITTGLRYAPEELPFLEEKH